MIYITMTDKFMSNWGMAKGKINKLVIACENEAEADTVEDNARARKDMSYINRAYDKPSYNSGKYLVSWKDKETYNNWFKANAFKN